MNVVLTGYLPWHRGFTLFLSLWLTMYALRCLCTPAAGLFPSRRHLTEEVCELKWTWATSLWSMKITVFLHNKNTTECSMHLQLTIVIETIIYCDKINKWDILNDITNAKHWRPQTDAEREWSNSFQSSSIAVFPFRVPLTRAAGYDLCRFMKMYLFVTKRYLKKWCCLQFIEDIVIVQCGASLRRT